MCLFVSRARTSFAPAGSLLVVALGICVFSLSFVSVVVVVAVVVGRLDVYLTRLDASYRRRRRRRCRVLVTTRPQSQVVVGTVVVR